jgi:hypothetical protein
MRAQAIARGYLFTNPGSSGDFRRRNCESSIINTLRANTLRAHCGAATGTARDQTTPSAQLPRMKGVAAGRPRSIPQNAGAEMRVAAAEPRSRRLFATADCAPH